MTILTREQSTVENLEEDLAELRNYIDISVLEYGSNINVATIAERDSILAPALNIGDNVFVADKGDGKWGVYKVTAITDGAGSTSTFLKIIDENANDIKEQELITTGKTINNNIIELNETAIGDALFNSARIFEDEQSNIFFEVTCLISSDGSKVIFDPADNLNGLYGVVSYLSYAKI